MDQTQRLLAFFAYAHLPDYLQPMSKEFHDVANRVATMTPSSPETTVGLRKLLEAKDCFVRAVVENRR